MIKDLFVSYDIAVALKTKGFNVPCIACYDKCDMLSTYSNVFKPKNYNNSAYCISAPLYQQVISWFLKEHNLSIEYSTSACSYTCSIVKNQITNVYYEMDFKTPLDSIKNGIIEALKLI